MYCYCYVRSVLYILFSSYQLTLVGYPDWGFSVLSFSCKENARYNSQRRDTARTLPNLWIMLFYVSFVSIVLFYVLLVSFVLFYVLFVCKCVLYYCHRVSTQLQLTNISYRIISYTISYHIISYQFCSHYRTTPKIAKSHY